jgi:SPP1 gp7 family putative phage head morphogenesis protein
MLKTKVSSNYWDKRAIDRMSTAEKQSEAYISRVKSMYNQAFKNIDNEIAKVYQNYSKDTGLDIEKLKQLLTVNETSKTWKMLKKQGLDKYIKTNYKSRISRLEQIQAQIYAKAKQIYPKEELQNTMCYRGVINNSYYKAVYDTQMATGYDFSFNKIDKNLFNTLLNEKWSGKNYSQRIWENTDILAESVSQVVGGALLSGQSIEKTSKQIRDRFNVSKYYAERLVRTETNHFHNEVDALAYEEMGVKEYVFVAVLDSRTSEICQANDNKKFLYKDKQIGVNYPPLHPNCRSTTRGYLGEEAEKRLKRRARNPITGKNEIIDNISYSDWLKQKGVTNGASSIETNKLKNTVKDDIITPSNLLDKLSMDIKDYQPLGKIDPYENNIQEQTAKLLKYDSKPKVVNKETFNKTEGKEILRVVHEYHGNTADEVYKNTLYGDIRYSEVFNSSYGRGIYFGDKSEESNIVSTYSKGDSKIINAKLSSNANIIEFKNQSDYVMAVTKRLRNVPKELQQFYQNERSLLFMLDKVDGIKIKSNGYYCIYNRGVLIINE